MLPQGEDCNKHGSWAPISRAGKLGADGARECFATMLGRRGATTPLQTTCSLLAALAAVVSLI